MLLFFTEGKYKFWQKWNAKIYRISFFKLKNINSQGDIIAEIPIESIKNIMKKAGVEEVNEEAAQLLAEALEEIALDLSKEAELLAKHAGRKTVEVADIKLALRL